MIDNELSTKAKIFDVLVNMNKTIIKQKLEKYGIEEQQTIQISGSKVQRLFGPNNASISSEYKIDDIQLTKTKNQFRSKLRKNSRVEVVA
jgi:hypothetical protein